MELKEGGKGGTAFFDSNGSAIDGCDAATLLVDGRKEVLDISYCS